MYSLQNYNSINIIFVIELELFLNVLPKKKKRNTFNCVIIGMSIILIYLKLDFTSNLFSFFQHITLFYIIYITSSYFTLKKSLHQFS
jgi:hypothetical protein